MNFHSDILKRIDRFLDLYELRIRTTTNSAVFESAKRDMKKEEQEK